MKKFLFLSFFCLFLMTDLFSQIVVSGKITDLTGNILPGANIVCEPYNIGAVSDNKGNYSLTIPQSGLIKFRVSFIGYKPSIRAVQLRKNANIDFRLEEEHLITDEVVVSAIRASSKTPVAYTNMAKSELEERRTGNDIPYLISMSPSAVSTSESGTGLGYTALRIRGADPTRINITANGIPLNDSESQAVFWANMPDFSGSVEEIQIQRGVGTSTNGPAAFGATINLRTNNYQPIPLATISSAVGSFNTFINSVAVSSGLINNRFAFDARYSDLQSDGYVRRAFSDHHSLFLSGTMLGNNNMLKATIIHGNQQTGISWNGATKEEMTLDRRYNSAGRYTDELGQVRFYDKETDNYRQTHYQLAWSQSIANRLSINTAIHYTHGEGFYESYKENRKYSKYGWDKVTIGNLVIDRTDAIQQKWMLNYFYGATASGVYQLDKLSLSVGSGWNRYDGDHYGEVVWMRVMGNHENGDRWYFNNGDKRDFNIFAKANWQPVGQINVMFDLQYRRIGYAITGEDDDNIEMNIDHNYSFFNPKAGFFYDLNDKNQLYASIGISNREPTRTNLKDAKGDAKATPLPERLIDWEAGYRFGSKGVSANINLFYMDYKDQLLPTGEKSEVGYDIMTNVPDSYRAGIEIVGGVQITKWLKWDANLSLSTNKIENFVMQGPILDQYWSETGEWLKKSPVKSDIAYSPNTIAGSIISISPTKQLKVDWITKYVGSQYFDNTSSAQRRLDNYTVHNLQLDYHFYPPKMQRISLSLIINNLLNTKYINNAYGGVSFFENGAGAPTEETWAYYHPQAGTNIMTKITLTF